jgi:DNA-binding NarL/FixJ family response regulator
MRDLGWRNGTAIHEGDGRVERTVVVVDDDEDTRFVIARGLARVEGFRVLGEGASGADAIALVQEHRPDVLLLDLGLPDVDEEDLIPNLLVAAPRTMVAVLTGRAAEDREARARAAGAFTYYEKDMIGRRLYDYLTYDCDLFTRAVEGEDVVAPSAITRRRS